MDNLAYRMIYCFRAVPTPNLEAPYMDSYQITVNPAAGQ